MLPAPLKTSANSATSNILLWFRRRCDGILSNSSFRSSLLQPHQRVNSSQVLPQHLNRVLVQTLNFFFLFSASFHFYFSFHSQVDSLICLRMIVMLQWHLSFNRQTDGLMLSSPDLSLLESGIPSIIAWTLERESIPTTLCCCFLWNITGPQCLIYMIWIFFFAFNRCFTLHVCSVPLRT